MFYVNYKIYKERKKTLNLHFLVEQKSKKISLKVAFVCLQFIAKSDLNIFFRLIYIFNKAYLIKKKTQQENFIVSLTRIEGSRSCFLIVKHKEITTTTTTTIVQFSFCFFPKEITSFFFKFYFCFTCKFLIEFYPQKYMEKNGWKRKSRARRVCCKYRIQIFFFTIKSFKNHNFCAIVAPFSLFLSFLGYFFNFATTTIKINKTINQKMDTRLPLTCLLTLLDS